MIVHPDGRIEGTPEEIMQYQKLQSEKQTKDWWKRQGTGCDPILFPQITCGQGRIGTYEAWPK